MRSYPDRFGGAIDNIEVFLGEVVGIGPADASGCPKPIFADGFESGDTSAWSSSVP